MHIHGDRMNSNALNPYTAAAENAAQTAAAQRRADVRRKLMSSAKDIEDRSSFDETSMVGEWTNSLHAEKPAGGK